MPRLQLTTEEIDTIQSLLDELGERYPSAESVGFHKNSAVYSHRLPERVRCFLNDFRLEEPSDGCAIVSGFPMDQERIGPTPEHWKNRPSSPPTAREDMLFVLFSNLLGDCIGWSTQQSGYMVHDIFPIQGNEGEQLGTGSEELLWWHTEDAFHEYRGDYIGMMCIRNPDAVPTTIGTLKNIEIPREDLKLLFERHFSIRPDESHLKKNRDGNLEVDEQLEEAFGRMELHNVAPPQIPVLFGSPENPYMRLDPYFMEKADTPEAQAALDRLVAQLDEVLCDVPLAEGDFCFVDNLKAIHGRKPFKARYDGTDRWIKRVIIARDLRKSRGSRAGTEARLIL